MNKRIVCTILISIMIIFQGCQTKSIQNNIQTEEFEGSIILGRPTNSSITASITSKIEGEIYLAYGEKSGDYLYKTDTQKVNETEPAVFLMENLSANNMYYYSIYFKEENQSDFKVSKEYKFNTPKNSGETFNFTVQSDSHLLNKADTDMYKASMEKMNELNPDFVFDLGDTFLLDNGDNKNTTLTQEKVNEIYRQQLEYFDNATRNSALFLAVGNHESEYGNLIDGTTDNLATKGTIARTTYYPNPIPNEFYSGNEEVDSLVGSVQNYYAFQWGDALFLAIDPYRYSTNGASEDIKSDGWGWTLGKTQYDWFRKTLEESNAKYKFVFSHHAIGNMRGGAEIASLYEWGGYDKSGKYMFDEKRPGWGKPIQEIMKDEDVTIFFQGHDHLFAREEVDGVVYQTVPKPAEKIADNQNNFKYYKGDVLLNSGFLNITVSSDGVQVDYNRNYLVASGEQTTGIVYSYKIDEKGEVTVIKDTEDSLENYGLNEVLDKGNTDKVNSKDNKNKDTSSNTSEKGENRKNDELADYVGVGATPAKSITTVPEDGFSFAIEADPHFDENSNDITMKQTANNIVSTNPSFLIDLGDTAMLEKLGKTEEERNKRNEMVKEYFDYFGDLPIKMVTGNHDTAINTKEGNYYSFTENNALFIVLDPFAYSTATVGKGGGWATTLGKEQYDWLKTTLENSDEDFKFVFIHNMTGGIGKDSRGGAEAASFYEWGGLNEAGVDEFSDKRQGWDMPIHDLLLKYGVNAVFHGHDHFYAKQEKDGIIYQLVPQTGSLGNSVNDAVDYGYDSGVRLPSAGFLRVVVSDAEATVEYLKTESDGSYSILDTYKITNN